MKTKMRKLLMIFCVIMGISAAAVASDGHNHEAAVEPAPHGGILRDASPYKVELVLNGDNAKIYVYDAKLKIVSLKATSLEGKIRLPKQKKESDVKFTKEGDFYKSVLKGVSKVHRYDLHVNLVEDGKNTVMDFGIDNIH